MKPSIRTPPASANMPFDGGRRMRWLLSSTQCESWNEDERGPMVHKPQLHNSASHLVTIAITSSADVGKPSHEIVGIEPFDCLDALQIVVCLES